MMHATAMVWTLAQPTWLVNLLLPAGLMMIVMSLLMWGRKKRARMGQTRVTAREQFHQMREEKAVRGDLEQIMVEIEQLAKRMSAQLDAKSMRLERLLADADAKIAELERRQGQVGSGRETPAFPPPREPQASEPAASVSSSPEPAADDAAGDERALAESVYKLADAGLKPLEIARELNEHQGKVELVLALRQT
ncbi:MAG: hypothetical protein WD534_12430 [Phycisphaeraceae bacterium]